MKLGIVGMLPGDFREHTDAQFEAICALGFTGGCFHFPGELAGDIRPDDVARCVERFHNHGLDLAQFAITYRECLFDPDPEVRAHVTRKIASAVKVGADVGAPHILIRPGSRNPAGSWTPHPDNHTPEAWRLLVETLGPISAAFEEHGVTAVVETHVVSILRDPVTCRRLVEEVGSERVRLIMDYVNHFESIRHVYESRERLDHIFDENGALSPVMHIKDIAVGNRLVTHLDECAPGDGHLDIAHALRRFDAFFPDGYGLIEHLKPDAIPAATEALRRIASRASVQIR